MAENIAEKLTINDVKMKLFHPEEDTENSEGSANNEKVANALVKSIAIPSTSRQGATYAKKKNTMKNIKKGKSQTISVLHLPNHPNKHIPIILKKSKLRVKTEKLFSELLKSTQQTRKTQQPNPEQEKMDQSEDSNDNEVANNQLFVREQLMIENADDIPIANNQEIIPFEGNVEKSDLEDFINNEEVQGLNICTDEYYAVQGKLLPNDNNMLVPYGNKAGNQQGNNNFEVSKFVKIKHLVSILKGSEEDKEEMETSNSVSSNDLVINEETANDVATVEQVTSFVSEIDGNVVTVASEDIPYNAEIEIGDDDVDNDSLIIEEVLELSDKKIEEIITEGEAQAEEVQEVSAKKVAEENTEASPFDQLKAESERKLFLEKEDAEFCRAAQRKISGILDYGYTGFKAIHKFNYILSLIPEESPATVHALMVAFKNKVAPVLSHLRYIQQCRKVIKASAQPVETAKNERPSTSSTKNTKQAKSSVSTRKKRISYDMDLSDNYADDSDEDYVPGKDLTPKRKKKRSKKKHWSKNKEKMTVFRECPVHKALFETQENKVKDEGASTSTNILANFSTVSSNFPVENGNGDDSEAMVHGKENKKKRTAGIFAKSEMLYKSEPIGKESLELTKFKKKRTPHSYIVPPVQKYMYAHEPVANYRFLALTKQ